MSLENAATLIVHPGKELEKINALASAPRIAILSLLKNKDLNINEIASRLDLPRSSATTNVAILEEAGLVHVEYKRAKKGLQKRCSLAFEKILIEF